MPRVDISNLPLSSDIIDKIATEKYLKCKIIITEVQSIEDAYIKLNGSHFPREEILSIEKCFMS